MMIKTNYSKIRIMFAIELMLLIIITVLILYKQNHPLNLSLDPDGFTSGNTIYDNLDLNPGSYSLIVEYESENDVYFTLSDPGSSVDIHGGHGFLRYQYDDINLHFRTREILHSLLITHDSAEGVSISSILITSNCDNLIRTLVILIFLFITADYPVYLFTLKYPLNTKETLKTVITLTLITVTASLPLFIPGILMGHDIAIHLQRIESIHQDLLRGAFPVRIGSSALRDYGYPVSVYYGDILLYPAALLRMAHFDITETWKIYFFVMNAATAIITYKCSEKIFKDRDTSLILAFAYTTLPYRLGNLYARSAVGEFSAMTFYPLIALAVYKIYTDMIDREKSRRYSNLLALSLSCVICTHILSSEMIVFTLLLSAIILYKKTFNRDVLLTLIKAAAKTLLLSAYFIVPFIDYYLSTPTIISDIVGGQTPLIQAEGLKLTDFFSLPLTQNSCYLSPGILFTVTLAAGMVISIITLRKRNRKEYLMVFLTLISLIIAIMSTRYFPWDFLGSTHIGRIMGQIQFPWRFISILAILLTVLLGCMINHIGNEDPVRDRKKVMSLLVFCISVLTCSMITIVCARELSSMMPVNSCELDTEAIGSGEYVLSGCNVWYREINDTLISDANTGTVTDCRTNGTGVILECRTSGPSQDILVPKYNYKGYRAYDMNGNRLPLTDGPNKLISVILPADYEGSVSVRYVEPGYWRLAELISLITLLFLILSRGKHRKNQ